MTRLNEEGGKTDYRYESKEARTRQIYNSLDGCYTTVIPVSVVVQLLGREQPTYDKSERSKSQLSALALQEDRMKWQRGISPMSGQTLLRSHPDVDDVETPSVNAQLGRAP